MKIGISKVLTLMLCPILLVGCSSYTPAKVNYLDMNNEPITMKHIAQGPSVPTELDIHSNFVMNGGYWAMTIHELPDAPVVTGITPPGWVGVDVQGPPIGSIGSIGIQSGHGYTPNMLASIVEVDDMEEAKKQGMSILRPKENGSWSVKDEGNDGGYDTIQYQGRWVTGGTQLISESIVYYIPVGDVNLVYSLVFTRELNINAAQWDREYPFVLQSTRVRDRGDFS